MLKDGWDELISTHSPRVGRTPRENPPAPIFRNFNSLAPCGANQAERRGATDRYHFNSLAPCGANLGSSDVTNLALLFQLTRPVWGEPRLLCGFAEVIGNFNSLAPCGANLLVDFVSLTVSAFQLTRPVWGEPTMPLKVNGVLIISTHSPRVGRTSLCPVLYVRSLDFNSLAPCGANRVVSVGRCSGHPFQLTRPVWGEPLKIFCKNVRNPKFQLTRPVWGEPACRICSRYHTQHFNSLAPCGANLYFLLNQHS